MARKRESLIVRLLQFGAIARWAAAARNAPFADLDVLRHQRHRARQIRAHVNELMNVADNRLALPRIGSDAFPRLEGTEWSWRPQLWRSPLARKGMSAFPSKTGVDDEITIFHNCKTSELTLRQVRNTCDADLAPFALRMDVFRFDGSFLSLAIDSPQSACDGLRSRHIVGVNAILDIEKPIEVLARLNMKHGPNTEQLVLKIPLGQKNCMVEFDLGYLKLNIKRIERMWLDLIFEGPEMNQITIRDITFCRYNRAEI